MGIPEKYGGGAMRDYPIEMYLQNAVCMLHSDGGVINKRIRILYGLGRD